MDETDEAEEDMELEEEKHKRKIRNKQYQVPFPPQEQYHLYSHKKGNAISPSGYYSPLPTPVLRFLYLFHQHLSVKGLAVR